MCSPDIWVVKVGPKPVLGMIPAFHGWCGARFRVYFGPGLDLQRLKRPNRCGPIPLYTPRSTISLVCGGRFVALRPLLDGPAVYLDSSEQGTGHGDEG